METDQLLADAIMNLEKPTDFGKQEYATRALAYSLMAIALEFKRFNDLKERQGR